MLFVPTKYPRRAHELPTPATITPMEPPVTSPKPRPTNRHRGVVIIPRKLPSGAVRWQFRYSDPDTGEVRKPFFPHPTAATKRGPPRAVVLWAEKKSCELAQRRLELEGGGKRVASVALAEAVNRYFAEKAHELRPSTIATYKFSLDPFVAWCSKHGASTTDSLTHARLMTWRAHVAGINRRERLEGGKRGEMADTSNTRSVVSVNNDVRAVKTVLNNLRVRGWLKLSGDDLRDTLKPLRVQNVRPEFLRPHELQKLLQAAVRHDAETFAATREEHAGLRPLGSTRRYQPIAPFLAFLLVTGCRRGEALTLEWSDVDLAALDHDGREVGEVRVRADVSKTHTERVVGLEVAPTLRTMLASMRLASGGEGAVFRISLGEVEAARKRLVDTYGAPAFSWQMLRSTCGTYLTNAPGIFGAASAYRSAKQLGHSVQVAEKHYTGVLRGIPRDARDLEAAMQINTEMGKVLTSLESAGRGANVVSLAGMRS